MNGRVPGDVSLIVLVAASVCGWMIGGWIAGPLPTIDRVVYEREYDSTNYTLETIRALSRPQPQYVRPEMPMRSGCQRFIVASTSFYSPEMAEVCP